MATHNRLGHRGEEEACRYLVEHDYRLLHRNWRIGHLEIDIVAEDYGEIVFVEVKTRSDADAAAEAALLTPEKRAFLARAAEAYLTYFRLDAPYRFDVIALTAGETAFEIEHIRNAFDAPTAVEAIRRKLYGH